MELSIEELQLLARRARLALTEEELHKYCLDLGALEELSAALLPYTDAAPNSDEPQGLTDMREDIRKPSLPKEEWLCSAPTHVGDYVPVPCVVEETEHE